MLWRWESYTTPLTLPLPSPLPPQFTSENYSLDLESDCNIFFWHKYSYGERYQHFIMDHGPPSGRDDGHLYSSYVDARLNNNAKD